MASNGASLKKRKTPARPAAPAPHTEDDAPPLLSTVKRSRRSATVGGAGRDDSEFVSVEVGLRELHKRMASSSSATPSSRATGKKKAEGNGTREASTEKQREMKPATTRKKVAVQGVDGEALDPTASTPKRRAPSKATAARPKAAASATAVPAKKPGSAVPTAGKRAGGSRSTAAAGSALAEARAAAMQQQQERVQQRVLGLQQATDTRAAVLQEAPGVIKVASYASPSPQQRLNQPVQTNTTSIAAVTPAVTPETSTADFNDDTTQTSQGFIEEDYDEDLVFLQALEEVERKLQPTTISGVATSNVPVSAAELTMDAHVSVNTPVVAPAPSVQHPQAVIIKQELVQAVVTSAAAASTPTLPPEMLAEYERLKRENEALRRSKDILQAAKSTQAVMAQGAFPSSAVVNGLAPSSQSASPAADNCNDEINPVILAPVETSSDFSIVSHASRNTEETGGSSRSHHQEVEVSPEANLYNGVSPDGYGHRDGDTASGKGGGDHDEDMDSTRETIDYGHDEGDDIGKEEGEDEEEGPEEDEVEEEEEEEEEDNPQSREQNGSAEENRVSTIDRGNYAQYRAKERAEVDEEEDAALPPKAKETSIQNLAPRATAASQKRLLEASPHNEPMAPPIFADDGSETESDQELQVVHKLRRRAAALSESSSSSSSSEDSEDENADGSATGSNVLEAALRAATGRVPVKAPGNVKKEKRSMDPALLESRASPEKRVRVSANLEENVGRSPSTVPIEETPSVSRKAKKRRAAGASTTTMLSAKDKSTLMWPTLDAFYNFVLELTPRRVLHSDPLHLQLLRAYEKARARLPMHYPGIKEYCDVQVESILEELLSSVRNAEELSLHNSSRARLWLSSISPCSTNAAGHSTIVKKATTVPALNPNVIFMESGFSGTSASGKSDFIITFQEKRGSNPHHKSGLSDFVGGDLLAMRSPQWREYDIYAFGIVLCSSVVAVGGPVASSRDSGGGGSSSSNADQLCVLVRAPPATAEDPDAASHFASVMEMCLVNEGAAQWSWSLEQVHNLTTSAREFQAIQSVRFFKPETKEMIMSGIIPEIVKTEQTQIIEPRKKLTSGLYEVLEKKYNPSQMQAILGAISDDSSISIIQGPPGTGKTKTILGVLSALLDGAALTASRQAQAKSRIRIGASLEQKKPSTAAGTQDKTSVAQESIRVLVAAPSNAAVDELIVRLLSEGVYDARQCKSYRPRIVRVGRPESLQQQLPSSGSGQQQRDLSRKKKWRKYASEVEEILLETLVNKNKSAFPTAKQARQTIIQNAQIVFCTLSGAGSVAMCELQTQHFDALVIDEAAQAVEASLLIPFKFQPSRVVLVGDHRQLPATVISKRLIELGYDRSLFQRLVENGSRVFMLTQQYRMHPEISWFPSTYFYNSKLIEAPQMKEWTARKYHREPLFRPFLFFDVLSGQQSQVAGSKSLRNVNEIECILQLLTRLVVDQFPELEWKRRIGIIAPYKQQIYELRNELQKWERQHDKRLDIEVNTVDGFQGREKEVIIYSCVRTGRAGQGRSSSRQNAQTIEAFWADERRMNVAITRAKSSLWIIGNSTLLKQSAAWRALITHAKDSRRYILDDELMGSQLQRSTGSANSRDKSRDKSRVRDGGDRHSRDRSQSRDRRRQ